MSKRKITQQQQRRISKQQNIRDSAPYSSEESLGPEKEGLLIRRFGKQAEVEDKQGQLHLCHFRQHLPTPVCGDEVIWRESTEDQGIIVAVKERRTQLLRVDKTGVLKPMAANVSQLFIVIATQPPTGFLQVDKLLIAANELQIAPVILVNKMDLPGSDVLYEHAKRLYGPLKYPILPVSAHEPQGLHSLIQQLEGHISIFVGHSGVGKSSLLKALLPHHAIEVGSLSLQSRVGTHTTTTACLYHLSPHSHLIDSPGIRQFSLWPIQKIQLLKGYPEFSPHSEHCQFRNCEHVNETLCAVKKALEDGIISSERYDHYVELLKTLKTEG